MSADPKATAITALRTAAAGIGLATVALKAGPYSWIGTLAQASTTAAADIIEAPDLGTPGARRIVAEALEPVFMALPGVSQSQSEDLAAGVVAAVRVIRKWST